MEINKIIELLNEASVMNDLHASTQYAIEDAVELLSKYVPAEIFTNDLDSPVCPLCKKMFHTLYHPYCSNCGQAIDWKNFEAAKKRNAMTPPEGYKFCG